MILTCGCCGTGFSGKRDWSHDLGFGTCPDCAEWMAADNEKRWRKITADVARALNPKNRRIFLRHSTDVQRGILLTMMEKGVIKWKVAAA